METDGIVVHSATANLYEQVREDLLRRIRQGNLKSVRMLPPEEELCRQYGVSSITMRRAVADLVAQFVVVRKRGIGTIITDRTTSRRAFRLTGFLDKRATIQAEPLSDSEELADKDVAARLGIEPGAAVRHICAVARRDSEPFTVTDAYTPEKMPARSSGVRVTRTRLLGERIERAEQDLDAIAADEAVAKLLGIKPGLPIMRARRVYFNTDGVAVRYIIVQYHPERYQFTVELRPAAGASVFEPTP
jgi:GntR family transcriptional regulator